MLAPKTSRRVAFKALRCRAISRRPRSEGSDHLHVERSSRGATGGSYTFTFGDLSFPVALSSAPKWPCFREAYPSSRRTDDAGITSGTTLSLPAGTYQLLGIAQADRR